MIEHGSIPFAAAAKLGAAELRGRVCGAGGEGGSGLALRSVMLFGCEVKQGGKNHSNSMVVSCTPGRWSMGAVI